MLSIMKKILTTFIILFILLISFWYCSYYSTQSYEQNWIFRVPSWWWNITYSLGAWKLVYLWWEFWSRMSCTISWTNIFSNDSKVWFILINTWSNDIDLIFNCSNSYTSYKDIARMELDISWISFSCPACPTCPTCEECEECNECPTIDSQYCQENNLCPSSWTWSDCPVYTWDFNWSSLYINDIQHEWAWTINITIPEEFNWDYTNENDVFDLNIEWYNVDTEYIDWIIRTQNYKPTSEDFTRLVWMLAPYSKYLIFLLFMFIIWAWIKKPFKSKKL